ncbi:unnamed protein product [Heligmosomoides polygyrus]|uniref:RNA helicase n=1 Tax=Heligmosomoides polygyrus TaxID=6339 RepID=A0A183GEA1_HELPZ|nr:unnamed protein product [Heligmosomoides polygyrus]
MGWRVIVTAATNAAVAQIAGTILALDKLEDRSPDDHFTNQEREELLLAERDVSDLIDKVINTMFTHLPPEIVAITTSSLLNTTSSQGLFKNYFNDFDVILCDKASQVPEPVLAAILSRLRNSRHVHVGDLHQLEPYALCFRHVGPVRFGAHSIMPLITTFRVHPLLNTLLNSFVYEGNFGAAPPLRNVTCCWT